MKFVVTGRSLRRRISAASAARSAWIWWSQNRRQSSAWDGLGNVGIARGGSISQKSA